MRDIPDLRAPRTWEFGVQEHRAARSGLHTDFRLSDGKTAFSWAIRKGIPEPGQSHLAIRQQDHHPNYLRWEGTITDPYGKGDVKLRRAGMVRVLSTSPNKINIDLLDSRKGSKLTLIQTPAYGENRWLLVNRTPTASSRPDIPVGKQKFKETKPEELGQYLSNRYALTSKIDGASVIVNLGDRPEVFSARPSVTGQLLDHTQILKADEIKIPESMKGTKLRAEVFAVKGNKVLPMRALGGLMNSSPEKALAQMEKEGIQMYIAPYQVLTYRGSVMEGHPYREQLDVIKKVVDRMPKGWIMPDLALSSEKKKEMVEQIKKGKHPLTSEGMVAWPLDEVAATPVKLKFKPHDQVYIDAVFPLISGGKEQPLAGGFTYRLTPRGPVVGKVGTGFTAQLRKDLWDNRGEMKGKKVIIESMGQFPSGAYRAPSFISFHL